MPIASMGEVASRAPTPVEPTRYTWTNQMTLVPIDPAVLRAAEAQAAAEVRARRARTLAMVGAGVAALGAYQYAAKRRRAVGLALVGAGGGAFLLRHFIAHRMEVLGS